MDTWDSSLALRICEVWHWCWTFFCKWQKPISSFLHSPMSQREPPLLKHSIMSHALSCSLFLFFENISYVLRKALPKQWKRTIPSPLNVQLALCFQAGSVPSANPHLFFGLADGEKRSIIPENGFKLQWSPAMGSFTPLQPTHGLLCD